VGWPCPESAAAPHPRPLSAKCGLPHAADRRMIGVREPATGESRVDAALVQSVGPQAPELIQRKHAEMPTDRRELV
jgi:hypothetical protein